MSAHYRIDVDTAALVSAQERLSALATALTSRADQLDSAPGSMPVWQGAARTAVMTEVAALAGHTRGFAPLFTAAAEALGPFITAAVDAETNVLPDLDQRRQAALDLFDDAARTSAAQRSTAYQEIPADAGAQRRMWQTEADSAHEQRVSEAAGARDGALAGLDAEYAALVRGLEAQAAQASDGVGAAVVAVAPDQTVANALGGGGRMPLVDLFYDLATESRQAGIAAAQQLLEEGVDASAELIASIAARQDDPAFAAGFAGAASPEQLVELVGAFSSARQVESMYGSGDPKALEALDERYAGVLSAVGTTVGTATRGTGEFSMPADYADRWERLLLAEMPALTSGAAGLLLRHGRYSTPFLDQVSEAVYEADRAQDGYPHWRMNARAGGSYAGAVAPGGEEAHDVLASVMHALGGNPEAAQHFLTAGGTTDVTIDDQHVPVQARLLELMRGRLEDSRGEGLGDAIAAAAGDVRGASEQGRLSAELAAQAVALGAQMDVVEGEREGLDESLRPGLARVLGAHGDQLVTLSRSGDGTRPADLSQGWTLVPDAEFFGPDASVRANLDQAAVQRLLADLGAQDSETDVAVVVAGVAAAGRDMSQQAMRVEMSRNQDAGALLVAGMTLTVLGDASAATSGAVSWVIDNGYEGQSDEKERREAQAKAISTGLGALSTVPGLNLSAGASWGLGQVVAQVQEQIGDVDWRGDYSRLTAETEDRLVHAFIADAFATGMLTEESFARANELATLSGAPLATTYSPPPPEAFVTVDGERVLDPSSEAFLQWAEANTDRPGEEYVTTPFTTAFPQYGRGT